MSRSAFAARFTALVGEPVMHYVARWRMHVASTWLRERDARIADVAGRLGYQSEAAFSRAYKRFVGVPPGSARRIADPVESLRLSVGMSESRPITSSGAPGKALTAWKPGVRGVTPDDRAVTETVVNRRLTVRKIHEAEGRRAVRPRATSAPPARRRRGRGR
jgi:hypothetical protein